MPVGVSESVTPPESHSNTRRLVVFALGALALLLIVSIASNAEQFELGEVRTPEVRNVLPIEQDLGESRSNNDDTTGPDAPREPIEVPQWAVTALSVIFGAGLLYLLSRQRFSLRFRRPSMQINRSSSAEVTEEEQAEAIAEFARDLIDELKEGDSPRHAIQRAYAAVETGFGAQELARKLAETPQNYLNRIFGRHSSMQEPLAALTGLFQHARFSNEPVDETMRDEAIDALTAIRDYYKAFAWKKINNRRSKATT